MVALSSSTPSHGQTDYFINKSIEIVFDVAVDPTTVTESVFSLVDIASGAVFPVTVSVSPTSTSTVVLVPSGAFKENSEYRVLVIGADMALGYNLKAAGGDNLASTIVIEFTTGTTVYKIDTTVEKESSNLTLEGDLFLPSNVKALGYDFTITKIRPKNNKANVSPGLTGDNTIRFTFSEALYTTATDYEEWIEVDAFPLLNATEYLASGSTFGAGEIPDYSVAVTGNDLLVSFSGELPNNVAVKATLLDGITSLDGDTYGGSMNYSIATELSPQIYGVQTVAREVREVADTFTDDYIVAMLFKNTIWTWEKVGRAFDISSPTYAAKQHIIYSTVLDLMEDREYYKYVVAGTRRQLGDLNVSIDNVFGRIAMKIAKYTKAKEDAFESIVGGWQFKVGSNAAMYSEAAGNISRLWHDVNGRYTDTKYAHAQSDIPASNVVVNRRSKTNNPVW
jgi:hypothetical protein